MAPLGRPLVEVVATAKTSLKVEEILDDIGYYLTYGQCESVDVTQAQSLLLMGLAEGCRLK